MISNSQLNTPYRVIPSQVKRYTAHYRIPAEDSLVVPLKIFGEEVLCEVRWEDENGELHVIHSAMFVYSNLIQLNKMPDSRLQELWDHYYGSAINQRNSGETIM
ncbi:MAG: hypothetical protein ACOYXT_02005 [Bacteroidota bacterium]